jgi:hypothetical protein
MEATIKAGNVTSIHLPNQQSVPWLKFDYIREWLEGCGHAQQYSFAPPHLQSLILSWNVEVCFALDPRKAAGRDARQQIGRQIARCAHDLAGVSFLTGCSVFMAEAY